MTREEAIQRFQRMKKILSIPNSDAERTIEAIDMAIEALQADTEAHSYSISVCDSCKYIHVPFTHYPCSNCYDHEKYVEWKDQK